MAQGLQVFDENGKEVFSSSTRTFKVVASLKIERNSTRYVYSDLFLKDSPTYFVTPLLALGVGKDVQVSFSGNSCKVVIGDIIDRKVIDHTLVVIGVY